MTPLVRTARHLVAAIAGMLVLTSTASAQAVGDPIRPLDVRWLGHEVFVGFDSDYAQFVKAEALGGVTLFAASSPSGPLVARLAYAPPFGITLEGQPAAIFPNVPSGTYYLVAVYGIVATPAVAASDWRRLDVGLSPPCATVPKSALIRDEQLVNGSISVALFFSSVFRCATSFLLEAGSAPGLANLANFEYASQVLLSSTIPVGTYYVRIRGKNAVGVGPYSELIPVSVPNCQSSAPVPANSLTSQVIANTVTLSWEVDTPPGAPVTFTEVVMHHLTEAGHQAPILLFPGSASTLTATVPSGEYRIQLARGTRCGKTYSNLIVFSVP